MPNRIIKESICTSDSLAQLSWFEQVLFIRLIVLADDYGCYDGRTAIIKGHGFPLESVTEKQIADGLSKLGTAGIVNLYTVGGKPYLQLESWSKHQRIRDSKHKYPPPEERDLPQAAGEGGKLEQDAVSGEVSRQVAASRGELPQTAASGGLNPIPIPIQSESESQSESTCIGASAPDVRTSQIAEIIAYLNEKAGTNYRASSKNNKKHINARLNEGYTVQDFKTVIDKKCRDWLHNPEKPELAQYLRPETLFGSKFEGYLNAPERSRNGKFTGNSSEPPTWGEIL